MIFQKNWFLKKKFFSPDVWRVNPHFECHDAWKQKITTKINFLKIWFFKKLISGKNFLFPLKYGIWPLLLNVLMHANQIWQIASKERNLWQFLILKIFSTIGFWKIPFLGAQNVFFFSEVWHVTRHFECGNVCKQKITTKIRFFKILFFKKLVWGKNPKIYIFAPKWAV